MRSQLIHNVAKLGPLIGLVLIVIILSFLSDSFLTMNNIFNLLRQISINALIAFGMTFVILTAGIDLSVGSMLALGSALTAVMLSSGLDPVIAIFIGLMIGLLLGALNGLIITKGRVAPFIATLATMTIFRGITLVITDGKPVTGLSDSKIFEFIGKGYFFWIPIPIIIMIIVFFILYFVLNNTVFGRRVYAVGGNEETATLSGVKTDRIKIFVYAITGMLAVLAGIILTSRLNSAQPTAGTMYELDAIAAVVIGGTSLMGGRGRITGTLIGALIIGVISNGLNLLNVSSFYQQIVKGAVILFAVMLDRRKD
ncbi:ABC transporter permease subunit [Oceanobacillus aidingensis]|uniref:Ribose ABC transporter permease n=1 Tax=Oceanobacillus aidingensis TaxID=645964 RepID=A0ABV9JSM8_9BACI